MTKKSTLQSHLGKLQGPHKKTAIRPFRKMLWSWSWLGKDCWKIPVCRCQRSPQKVGKLDSAVVGELKFCGVASGALASGFQVSMQDLGHYRRNFHFELKDFGNFAAGAKNKPFKYSWQCVPSTVTFCDRKKVQRKEWEEWPACSDCSENFIQHSNVDVQWRKLFCVFSMRSTSTSIDGPANVWHGNDFELGNEESFRNLWIYENIWKYYETWSLSRNLWYTPRSFLQTASLPLKAMMLGSWSGFLLGPGLFSGAIINFHGGNSRSKTSGWLPKGGPDLPREVISEVWGVCFFLN